MLANLKFPDLLAVISALRRNVLLENCPQRLIYPCPRLPLNAIFSGYMDRGPGGQAEGEVAEGEVDR